MFPTLPSELGSNIGFYVLCATHFDVIREHFFQGGFKALVPIRSENILTPGMHVYISFSVEDGLKALLAYDWERFFKQS